MYKRFAVMLSCCAMSTVTQAQQVTLVPGTALRVELNHRVRIHRGATVQGHLTELVFLVDHQVVPAGSLVTGVIRGTRPGPKADHVRRLLAADFTPPRIPEVVFTSLALPSAASQPASTIPIDAPAELTTASVLTMGTRQKKQSIFAQARTAVQGGVHDALENVRRHDFTEAVEKYAIGQLPYHPEILWSRARFNADLATAAVLPDAAHTTVPTEDLRGRLPEGALHARLLTGLTSQTARRGDPVEAIITEPLYSPDHTKLLVPEGTHLHGKVVQAKAVRRLGRNGDLRFAFNRIDLPTSTGAIQPTDIHGRLSAAETTPGQHVVLDEEGQATATDSPAKYAEPLLLGILAGVATPDEDHRGASDGIGPGAQTVSSNGFGLVARVVSLTSGNTRVLQGFAYYSLAKSLYFNFVAKGKDTTFAHDTEVQVTLSER